MARTGGRNPNGTGGRTSFSAGALVWGALVVLATFIGIIQGPKAFVDLHELMCDSDWHGLAGRMRDCSGYRKLGETKEAIVSRPTIPAFELYQAQLKQFWAVFDDGDEGLIQDLKQNRFVLRTVNVCAVGTELMKKKDNVAKGIIDIFLEGVSRGPTCDRHYTAWNKVADVRKAPLDVVLLDQMVADHQDYRKAPLPGSVATIGLVTGRLGKSGEFLDVLPRYVAAFEVVGNRSRADFLATKEMRVALQKLAN